VDDRERVLLDLARRQLGVFSLDQAVGVGVPRRTIADRARRGIYERIHPGVYGIAGSAVVWHAEIVAAVLSCRALAAASHRTAALLWGMTDDVPATIEVSTTRHLRRPRRGVVLHESTDLEACDIEEVRGVPVTSAARTVVDLGASAPYWFVERCMDAALRLGLCSVEDVSAFIDRVGRSGRTGVGTARPIVEERWGWSMGTESELEDRFRRLIALTALDMPTAQYTVRDRAGRFVGRFDFAYPDRRILVELDSERWHMDPAAFQRDREKQNRAHALGWVVYRFTWGQITKDPASVLHVLASIRAG
jgi:hypothetical protein